MALPQWRAVRRTVLAVLALTVASPNAPTAFAQRESAARNLDWFNYWLPGERDPDPAKQEQYARWERMTKEMAWMRAYNVNARPTVGE